jgi:hypothetical protein
MSLNGRKHSEEALLTALACGASVEVAARTAHISVRTAHRWLAKAEFQQRLNGVKAEMVKRTSAMLTATGLEAGKTLRELLASDNDHVRLMAARALLELGAKYREAAEVEERLAILEQRLAEDESRTRAA